MNDTSEPAIRLHHCPETRSVRVLWLLGELGLDHDLVTWPFDKTLRSAEYGRINPLGRVPALEIDGRAMGESLAIMEYLCERHPGAGLHRAPGDPERADWLEWLHFAETVSQHTAALTQQHVAIREDAQRSPTVMKLEAARLARCLRVIEGRLATRDHLLDTGFSAADIALGQAVWMARHFVTLDATPRTAAWLARLEARPAFAAALPAPGEPTLYARDFYPAWEDGSPSPSPRVPR